MEISCSVQEECRKRIEDRNSRTLVLTLSEDLGITNKTALKEIVPNTVNIRIPNYCARNKFLKTVFAEFNTLKEAEETFDHLKNLQLPVGNIQVSHAENVNYDMDVNIDPLRLYISGIPEDSKTSDLKALFPNAIVNRNDTSKYRNRTDYKTFAVLTFKTQDETSNAFWLGKDVELSGSKLLVLYSKNNVKSKLICNEIAGKKKKIKRLQKSKQLKGLSTGKEQVKGKASKMKSFEENLKNTLKKSIEKDLIQLK